MSVTEWLPDPREWAVALCGSDAKARHGDVDERLPMVERRDDRDRQLRIEELARDVSALREQLSAAQEARELAEAKAGAHSSLRKAVAALVPSARSRMAEDPALPTDAILQLVHAHLKEGRQAEGPQAEQARLIASTNDASIAFA